MTIAFTMRVFARRFASGDSRGFLSRELPFSRLPGVVSARSSSWGHFWSVSAGGHDRAKKALLLPRLTHYVSGRVVELGDKKVICKLMLLVPSVWQLRSVGGQRSFERL